MKGKKQKGWEILDDSSVPGSFRYLIVTHVRELMCGTRVRSAEEVIQGLRP